MKAPRIRSVFLMDPLETVQFDKDTTLALMWASQARGHEVYYLPADGLTLKDGKVIFHATRVIPQKVRAKPFVIRQNADLPAEDVTIVFVRTDPPFDERYLLNTWILDRLPASVVVINDPAGIRTVNEKLWSAQFADLVPPTLVSRSQSEMLLFLRTHKDIIAKPTDGHGGKAVFRIKRADSNTNVIFETVSQNFKRAIILQKYIPAAARGDKRILLLNGQPLGAVLRVHAKGEHRNNIFAGGRTVAATITARDRVIIEALRPYLRDLGLYFVGIDVLGEYLTEVNVTSPTCLQEMNRLYHQTLENDVIAFAEDMALQRR